MAVAERIIQINIEEEMKSAYIDYSMSVIVSRALPDVRDGLKPVQRRVIYAMNELGLHHNKAYKKSARIVGECFVAGTMVSTPKGLVPIEHLQVDDEVYTQDAICKVTHLYIMPKQPLLTVETQNGNKNVCTRGQLFKVFTSDFQMIWKPADKLKKGDQIVLRELTPYVWQKNLKIGKETAAQTVNQLEGKHLGSDWMAMQTFSAHSNASVTASIVEKFIAQGITFSKVKSVKPAHSAITYDIQVADKHEFIANGMLVHNCLGKYHPHGDSSVYEAMVRMAQPWSLRVPLVDGQGNFGSMDGDSPAAIRYTEARLKRVTDEMIADIDKETVEFRLNFDDTLEEPTVLPSRLPNLLLNGASGIAVGMATNMLPHNLTEIVSGIIAYIDNTDISITELVKYITAPDFPTGGIIYGLEGVHQGFATGRGRVVLRGRTDIEEMSNNRQRIVAYEIPYQVNKATLIKRTADLINSKKIEGISDIRDESDRKGLRIVYELKRDANPQVVLNQLYSFTALQTSYGINNVCLVNGRPRLLNLKDLIKYFVEFRHEVVVRRTEYDLRQAEKRAHILAGLLIALDHIDAIIKLIRASQTSDEAKNGLMTRFELSEPQAKAILDMRLHRLTALERDKLQAAYDELMKKIAHLNDILSNESLRMNIIKEELLDIQARYGEKRRTDITAAEGEITIEDILENEQVVITISHLGYVKRTLLEEYREQNRGGKGSRGGATRDEDFIEHIFVGSTHDYLLVFTEQGKCHWLRVYNLPTGSKTSKGRAIQNIVNLPKTDKVKAYLTIRDLKDKEFLESHYIVFCTKKGLIKKTALEAFARPRQGGIIAIRINEGDSLLEAKLTNGNSEIFMGARSGSAIRFHEENVRSMGRTAAGVRGIKLADETDEVVGMACVDPSQMDEEVMILSISEKGYGKRTLLGEYRQTNRGGKGVRSILVTEKTGRLIAIKDVTNDNGLMIINKSGLTIRMSMDNVSVQGRSTQGVRLINLNGGDEIASVAKIVQQEEEDSE